MLWAYADGATLVRWCNPCLCALNIGVDRDFALNIIFYPLSPFRNQLKLKCIKAAKIWCLCLLNSRCNDGVIKVAGGGSWSCP